MGKGNKKTKSEHEKILDSRHVDDAGELRQSLNQSAQDINYKVDKTLKLNGPMKDRRCTDFLFTILFLAFAGACGYVCIQGFSNGDPGRLLSPVDYDGKLCGFDYPEHPKLYFLTQLDSSSTITDLKLDFKAICVSECPELNTTEPIDCKLIKDLTQANCDKQIDLTTGQPSTGFIGYGTKTLFGKFCLPNLNQLPANTTTIKIDEDQFNNIIGSFGLDDIEQFYEDIIDAKMIYLYIFLTCFVVTIFYNIMLRFFAKILVWFSIMVTGAALIIASVLLHKYYNEYYNPETTEFKQSDGTLIYSESMGNIIKITTYVMFGVTAFFFCMIMCMYNNIKISIAILQTSSVIVIRNMRILIIPIFSIAFTLSFLIGWLYAMGYILAQANINQPTGNSQLKSINLNGKDEVKWQIAIAVFGLFWGIELLGAIFDYAIIVGVSAWYFTSNHDTRGNFSLFRGFWWAFRYNFGSLAFGSFLLAIVWTIRIVFEYLDKKLKNLSENSQLIQCISNGIRCCLACFDRFIRFLNVNAYIHVCLTGNGFCSSAMSAFVLALKHSGSFLTVNGIGGLINILGKLTISVANSIIGYILIISLEETKNSVQEPLAPTAVIFIISYLMASIFMAVYSITSLTILQCLYADVDICEQEKKDKFTNEQRPAEMENIVRMLRKD